MSEQKKHCTILIKRRLKGETGPDPTLQSGELAFDENNGGNLYIGTLESPTLTGANPQDPGTI